MCLDQSTSQSMMGHIRFIVQDAQKVVQQGRSEQRGEAYPWGTLEPLSDERTKLAGFFSILI
jgi:septin family protein